MAGRLAENRLCPAARQAVAELLDGESLAQAGTWADGIRDQPAWRHTRDWHYLNLGDDEALSAAGDGAPRRGRLLEALPEAWATLRDPQAGRPARRDALRFFAHLLVDLHQPLHVGRFEDLGGNTIEVRLDGDVHNLHRVWDSELLRSSGLRWQDYARTLEPMVELAGASWVGGGWQDWAEESRSLRPWVYDFDRRRRLPMLSRRYAVAARQVVALRLAQAGVRLAAMLDDIWCAAGPGGPPEPP